MTHLERIQQAIDYIEAHLSDELAIEAIAGRAAFSPWHFQRIFGAMVGETVRSYVRKRRLSQAFDSLQASDARIADIAWAHGFESHEAFTRAFKTTFGITPGAVRRNAQPVAPPLQRIVLTPEYLHQRYGDIRMEPTFKQLDEISVIGLGSPFISILSPDQNNFTVIPALWDTLFRRIDEIPGRREEFSLGLCRSLPEGMERMHDDQFYYIAGVPVQSVDEVPTGMVSTVIPARTYAMFTHRGRLNRLQETMNYIYGSWLPNSDRERADGSVPDLEWYDGRFAHDSDTSEMDIYIPLR
jgi:AraC family transcriptional regulator